MELLSIGDKVTIKRSDGCIQSAVVGLKNTERKIVTVEWTQGTKLKGKEISWNSVLELNPSLAKAKETPKPKVVQKDQVIVEPKPRTPTTLNMYRKKSNNSPYKKRLRVPSKGDTIVAPPTVIKQQPKPQIPATPRVGNTIPIPVKTNLNTSNILHCSNVVREVERLKEERERRRALQAQQRLERCALQSKDPGNPNWEVALMVRTYRDQLQLNPLRYLSPQGARVQQITVCVRKRPMSRRELQAKTVDILTVPSHSSLIVHELRNKVDLTKFLEHHKFRFDYTFDEHCSNTLVYEHTAKPLIRTMFEGGNATCFAYGQTGSGKTHTMGGEFTGKVQDCTSGIYAMAARDVFAELAKPKYRELGARITCSYFEIYGSKVFDLLLPDKPLLRVLEDGRQQVVIVGLTQMPVTKVEEVLAIIEQGNRERTSGTTSVNIKSSRSHAVFQMSLIKPNTWEPCGKCSFVDLAGNERGADTQSANLQTRREGAEINKSLLALKECIRALSRHSSHLPFRGSKLTQVLRDSFVGGGQNKTCMIAMISPGLSSVENTLNTLRYADRVKELVANKEDVGEVSYRESHNGEDDQRNSEVDDVKPDAESGPEYKDSESEYSASEPELIVDRKELNSSQVSICNSSLHKCDLESSEGYGDEIQTNTKSVEITEVLMQHEVLFEFIHNFKMSFDKVVSESTKQKKKMCLTKFLVDVEPTLRELEDLVKHTHNLVTTYNSQQYLEGETIQAEENVDN